MSGKISGTLMKKVLPGARHAGWKGWQRGKTAPAGGRRAARDTAGGGEGEEEGERGCCVCRVLTEQDQTVRVK